MSKFIVCLVAAMALPALLAASATAATGGSAGAGLWPATYQASQTDCGSFSRDANNFCFIDDNGGVELGVKFTSSKAVNVTGVRIYRIDSGAVTGSLWAADGTLLAGPVGFSGTTTHAWQDVTFGTPVAIAPGQTYVASYFAPNADYAYEYDFFTDSSYTAGPITALESVAGDSNGVYCYAGGTCFPTNTFRDTNYWVTPLWAYAFAGFQQPVDNGALNTAKAGNAIPVKFDLGGDQGLDRLTRSTCSSSNA